MDQHVINTFVAANSIPVMDEGLLSSLQAQLSKFRPQVGVESFEEVIPLFAAKREDIEAEFNRLVNEWRSERGATSSSTAIAMHPAYQRIIGMGKPVLPLILRELSKELDHWFWALKAISGEDPVPIEHLGKMKMMAADWLQWGREKGYAR